MSSQRLSEPALAALRWIDGYGDRDGDGFVEYERRTQRGLENQSWKDSGDSQRFRDGRVAVTPIAPAEVQGYVYDAKLRMAELARAVWRDDALAVRLETEAAELRRRFDEQFWVEDRGGYYALALDGDKRRVDSLCSNIGHLLWSGIVPPRAGRCDRAPADGRRALVGPGDPDDVDRGRRLQPAHVPQRHGLAPRHVPLRLGPVAQRPCRRRRPDRADAVPGRLGTSTGRCPRSSPASAATRRRSRSRIRRPRGRRRGRPAAPVLMLRLLLGLEPDPHSGRARAPPRSRPSGWTGSSSTASARSGALAHRRCGRPASARRLHDMRVAVLSPVWFPVPPSGYGGIEWIVRCSPTVSADAGHDVTLFASGDSHDARKAGGCLRGSAERADRADLLGAPARPQLLRPSRRLRRDPRPHGPDGPRARLAALDARSSTRCTGRSTAIRATSTSRSCGWRRTRS